MFSISRSRALQSLAWSVDPSNNVEYIEAWKFSSDCSVIADNPRHGRLNDSKIEEWLRHDGLYAMPVPIDPDSNFEGGIRLVICEREWYQPPSFSMSMQSYLRIEEEFSLPQATLHALTNKCGIFSRYVEYDEKRPGKLKRIGIVVKAAQKYQVGNYGLSLSHDFETHVTTGLLHGTGVMNNRNDFPAWKESPSVEIFDLIKSVPHLWSQPMLLPAILLQHHISRAEIFCTLHLDDKANRLQNQLGMSRAGRLHLLRGPYGDPAGERPIKDTKVNLHNLTGELNTCITELIRFCRVSDWECDCVEFLARTLDEVASTAEFHAYSNLPEAREIRECIEYLASAAKGLKGHNNKTKERLQADFNVLSSLIAQIDNKLTAKMAATSSRDSTAMKTLALITTLFLPGTFVATVFSTGMFNWQSSAPNSSSQIVSSYIWIYWAFTIPLTITVAFSWRLWWAWEKRHLDRDVLLEIEKIEESASLNSWTKRDSGKEVEMSGPVFESALPSLRRRIGKKDDAEKKI
ncbi:hypothetical protein OIDMADRAFT_139651 [Oidiodendron maius Zn]|uniref:Uncharacterized protein n=1 Tax=Oidiodendron maius (strain Zn) TaxID=913774 RepID=A0A0C3HX84_OIDMZ|nr:hypothetical protein OIDMADRAFT_139651 [Oidiodendron maius Zn]